MIRRLSIQLIIFFIAFQLLSMLRETSMLATDTSLNELAASKVEENASPEGVRLDSIEFDKVPTLKGGVTSLYSQEKNTVLYFFAPWCKVCHVSIGNLQSLYEKNEQLNVIAIALDYNDKKEVMDFTNQHQLTFPVVLGSEAIKQTFEISGYPSYYIVDKQNTIVSKSMGYTSEIGLYLRSL